MTDNMSQIADLLLPYWRKKREQWAKVQADKEQVAYLQGQIDLAYKVITIIGNIERGKPPLHHVSL